jgi:DNA-binding transcriptional LysR family regulator
MSYRGTLPNLTHLRIFASVAEAGSASRAAHAVNRSQPTVTLALRKLEDFVGASLMDRSSGGSHPTEIGRIFLARILRLFERLDSALLQPMVGAPFVQADRLPALRAKLSTASMRGFIAIAEHDTLQEAAQAVDLSKPSLYRIARDLERILGRACFEHTERGLAANKSGTELARRFRLALREIDYALEEIETAQGAISSRIMIGVRRTCAMQPLSDAVKEFLALYPRAQVCVADGSYDQLLQDLRHGRIDLLYGALQLPDWADDVKEEALFYDPYSIAVRTGHPLTTKSRVTLADLADYDWIMPSVGSPRREAFERLFAGRTRLPTSSVETSSLDFQFTILASSDRITLMTAREVQQKIEQGQLTTISFPNLAPRDHDGIGMREDWHPTAAQAHFIELLRKHTMHVGTRPISEPSRKRAASSGQA